MENIDIQTKVVHSQSKTVFNVISTKLGTKFKIASCDYELINNIKIDEINRLESEFHAEFISYCFNHSKEINSYIDSQKVSFNLDRITLTKEQKDKLFKDWNQSLQDSHSIMVIESFNQNLKLEEKIKKITRIETKKYILLSIEIINNEELSWKEMYQIKDYFYEDFDFIEIYHKKDNLVDNGNVRHLYHCFDIQLPCLTKLENKTDFILTDLKL